MYSISTRQLELLLGVVCIVLGVAHWVFMFLTRRRPFRCKERVIGTCIRIEQEQGVSFFTSDSTVPRYSCVFGFLYGNRHVLVKQRSAYPKAQYAIGEKVDLFVNPDDLSDFWYRNKRGILYHTLIGLVYTAVGVANIIGVEIVHRVLSFLFS